VLAELRADPDLHTIPVTVLTTSSRDEDVLRSYELHANAYVTKPVGLDEFLHVVREIEGFWFQIVRIPEAPPR
jgi:two-component system, chemotaxis family, response regulator Rcp1